MPDVSGGLRRYRKDIAEQFSLGKVLGKGQFGTTRIAVHRGNGDKYACKTISKRKIVRKQVRHYFAFITRPCFALGLNAQVLSNRSARHNNARLTLLAHAGP